MISPRYFSPDSEGESEGNGRAKQGMCDNVPSMFFQQISRRFQPVQSPRARAQAAVTAAPAPATEATAAAATSWCWRPWRSLRGSQAPPWQRRTGCHCARCSRRRRDRRRDGRHRRCRTRTDHGARAAETTTQARITIRHTCLYT